MFQAEQMRVNDTGNGIASSGRSPKIASDTKQYSRMTSHSNDDVMAGFRWGNGVRISPGADVKFSVNQQGDLKMHSSLLTGCYIPKASNQLSPRSEMEKVENKNDVIPAENFSNHVTSACNQINDVTQHSRGQTKSSMSSEAKDENKRDVMCDDVFDGSLSTWSEKKEKSDGLHDEILGESENYKNLKEGLNTNTQFTYDNNHFYGRGKISTSVNYISCLFCGNTGNIRSFFGRFCSKQCVARNAARHKVKGMKSNTMMRKQERKRLRSYENGLALSTDNEPGDLKIKIRRNLSVVEEDEDYQPSPAKRRHVVTPPPLKLKRDFVWEDYLSSQKARGAPLDIFEELTGSKAFPSNPNRFRVEWLLEAVDPLHQSMICLVSVAAVMGNRLRIHFVGFPAIYDFWVNSDSPFIFPCGFAQRTGRRLSPPCGCEEEGFCWKTFAQKHDFQIAPDDAFSSILYENETGFKILDRIEAIDRHHPELVCVASIVDAMGKYLLIHFDGWNSCYDYWTLATSNYIRPIGWCKEITYELSPPLGFDENETFDWETYLQKNDFRAADVGLFRNEPHRFEIGMKLEVVDQRNCRLIRVATIADFDDFRVQVHFDGWSDMYDFWIDADSRDLHPLQWCNETQHQLQGPVNSNETPRGDQCRCPVPGCNGAGHVKHDKFENHHSEFGCPYSLQNLNREALPDRLTYDKTRSYDDVTIDANNNKKTNATFVVKRKRGRPRINRLPSPVEEKESPGERVKTRASMTSNGHSRRHRSKEHSKRLSTFKARSPLYEAAFMTSLSERQNQSELSLGWDQHVMSLPGVKGKRASEVSQWGMEQVSRFVNELTGKSECGDVFVSQEIDGEAFMLLTQSDISSVLKLKLGPSVKIYNAILMFKAAEKVNSF
ncbi:lethal(3)malignant brain tumor-like protein 4 [Clavelina lepadiformis]|uniref:lethal(3)malignant brain tumor-like protein 4 n=1 Tax=Clavelina lepadiformis TaxID=159417 RepID=UPI0040413904